jgi:hypothetical protein
MLNLIERVSTVSQLSSQTVSSKHLFMKKEDKCKVKLIPKNKIRQERKGEDDQNSCEAF